MQIENNNIQSSKEFEKKNPISDNSNQINKKGFILQKKILIPIIIILVLGIIISLIIIIKKFSNKQKNQLNLMNN